MRRWTARLSVLLCASAAGVAAAAVPAAAARGFQVQIEEAPAELTAGAGPDTLRVVVTKQSGGECLKVRWSMVLTVEGVKLDDVTVDRIEDSGQFPVTVDATDDSARITDRQPDPGTLCRNRTVTARYRVGVAPAATAGTVTFQVEAYDADQRFLERATATRTVVGDAEPTPTPTPTPEDSPSADPPVAAGGDAVPPPGQQANTGTAVQLPQLGFIIGAVLVFLGVGLLLQVRRGLRRAKAEVTRMTPRRRPYR
jgi:hypothetical protein